MVQSNMAPRPHAAASIGRGALALLSTQPLTWTASLLTAALVPHFLGDSKLGDYTLAVTITGLTGILVSAGIPGSLARHVATHPERGHSDGVAALTLVVGLAAIAAI